MSTAGKKAPGSQPPESFEETEPSNPNHTRQISPIDLPFAYAESPVTSPRPSRRPSRGSSPSGFKGKSRMFSEPMSRVTLMPETVDLEEPQANTQNDVIGKHTVYTIKGKDTTGPFEMQRRFKEFDLLRKELLERWPGVFIPPLPPKKAFGNMDQQFVNVRRVQLLGFMQKIASYPFLYKSDEYQQFIRGNANYELSVAALECASSRRILDKYKRFFTPPGSEDEQSLQDALKSYEKDFKNQIDKLRDLKHQTKALRDTYSSLQSGLFGFTESVRAFEPTLRNEDFGSEEIESWFEYPQRSRDFINPYEILYNWFVIEKQECSAIYSAITSRNSLVVRRKMALSDKENSERKFKKLCEGKFVMGWGSKNKRKNKLEVHITYLTDEVEYLREIAKIITSRIVKEEVPDFLEKRAIRYASLMQDFGSSASQEFEEMLKNALVMGTRQMGQLDQDE